MKIHLSHRLIFLSAWGIGLLFLCVFPGQSFSSLAAGMIIGYWPFALWGEVGDWPTLILIVAFSGIQVGLVAWLLDFRNLSQKIFTFLPAIILTGMITYVLINHINFEDWAIEMSYYVPQEYVITRIEYYQKLIIPMALVGGIWSIYLTLFLSSLVSLITWPRKV